MAEIVVGVVKMGAGPIIQPRMSNASSGEVHALFDIIANAVMTTMLKELDLGLADGS